MIANLKEKVQKHLRHITTITFFTGFAFDMFLLPDVNDSLSRYIGFVYIFLMAVFIVLRIRLQDINKNSKLILNSITALTLGIAYLSGSALSFVFVYAFRSADLLVSWPLFIILFVCMLINELVSNIRWRLIVDISVFIVSLTFYTLFNLPFLLNKQNDLIFFLGLGLSFSISFSFIKLITHVSKKINPITLHFISILIPSLIGGLYILNLMPAVPLSIKNSNVYHYVQKQSTDYYALKEVRDQSFLDKFKYPVYYVNATNTTLYFFAAVRAPAALTAPISHVWEYYNSNTKSWETRNKLTFNIYGGRQDGYRAYSNINNAVPGKWRVTVKLDNNRIIGRYTFNVQNSTSIPLAEVKL
jgi:hypothetical protein